MPESILLTGANGSAAVHTVRYLLKHQPDTHLVLTVRNASDTDGNTNVLRKTIADFPSAKATIRPLDLSSLTAVNTFAKSLAAEISRSELPPLKSIICNAYWWNLTKALEMTNDGYEKTFQINHIAHAALILQLLGSFSPNGGRIVLFTSDAHWPGKNSLEKIPPAIPADLQLLAKPPTDAQENHMAHGFNRYAVSKLVILMWTYALNRHIEKVQIRIALAGYANRIAKVPQYENITAVAINPGNLSDSRALRVNTPRMIQIMSKVVIQPMRPLLRLMDPTMRLSSEAGIDIAKLAINEASPGVRGFFTLLKEDTSSPDSLKTDVQERIWETTFDWTGVSKEHAGITA